MGAIDGYLDQLLARFDAATSPATPDHTTSISTPPARNRRIISARFIENGVREGERSERFAEVVWHFAGEGMSIEEIVEETR